MGLEGFAIADLRFAIDPSPLGGIGTSPALGLGTDKKECLPHRDAEGERGRQGEGEKSAPPKTRMISLANRGLHARSARRQRRRADWRRMRPQASSITEIVARNGSLEIRASDQTWTIGRMVSRAVAVRTTM